MHQQEITSTYYLFQKAADHLRQAGGGGLWTPYTLPLDLPCISMYHKVASFKAYIGPQGCAHRNDHEFVLLLLLRNFSYHYLYLVTISLSQKLSFKEFGTKICYTRNNSIQPYSNLQGKWQNSNYILDLDFIKTRTTNKTRDVIEIGGMREN